MDRVAVAKELVDIAKELDERYEETGNQKYLRLSNAVTDTLKEVVAEHRAMQRSAQGVGENFGRRIDQYGKGVRDWGRGVGQGVSNAYQGAANYMSQLPSAFDEAVIDPAAQGLYDTSRAVGQGAQMIGQGAQAAGRAIGQGAMDAAKAPGRAAKGYYDWANSPDGGADQQLLALQRQYGQLSAQLQQLPAGHPQAAQIQQQLSAIRTQGQQLRQQQNWPPNPAVNRQY